MRPSLGKRRSALLKLFLPFEGPNDECHDGSVEKASSVAALQGGMGGRRSIKLALTDVASRRSY